MFIIILKFKFQIITSILISPNSKQSDCEYWTDSSLLYYWKILRFGESKLILYLTYMKEFAGLDCSICYEKFTSTIRSNSYPVVLTQCGHSYCKGCSVRLHGKSCVLGCNIVIDFRKCVPNFGLISVIDEISQFLSKFGPQTRSKFFGLKTIFCHNSVFYRASI